MKLLNKKNYAHGLYALVILLCLGSIIYSNTMEVPFLFDDQDNIQSNQHIRLSELNAESLYDAAFRSLHSARPVANISFALNYYFGQYDVYGYHLVNIIIHILNGLMVYFLVSVTLRAFPDRTGVRANLESRIFLISLFTACIFIAHPLQIQAVTYIVQRMTSLSALFYFMGLLLYIHGRLNRNTNRQFIFLAGSFIAGLVAMGCKQTAATFPIIILLYEWFFFQDVSKRWIDKNLKFLLLVPLLVVAISLFYLGDNPLERILQDYAGRNFTLWERVITEWRVIIFYISLTLLPLPARLNLLHEFQISHSLLDPLTTLFSLLLILVIFIFAFLLVRKQRLAAFCIFWFFIQLVIESSIIGLELIFEHRLYLPLFGFSLLFAISLHHLLIEKQKALCVVMIMIIAALGSMSYTRNKDWQSESIFWEDVVAKSPGSYRASFNYGKALQNAGNLEEAADQYLKTIELLPTHDGAFNNLGIIHIKNKKYHDALVSLSRAISVNPANADALANTGLALEKLKQPDKAMSFYQKAIQIKPSHSNAHYLLGSLFQVQGNSKRAITHYQQSLKFNEQQPQVHNNLGTLLVDLGKLFLATEHFNRAIEIRPDFLYPYLNLAYVKQLQGNIESACQYYYQGLKIKPDLKSIQDDIVKYCQ